MQIELNEHTRQIFGRVNFACRPIAEGLRKLGHVIPEKSEEEQAAAICWMLNLYLEHGDKWAEIGAEILRNAQKPKDALAGE